MACEAFKQPKQVNDLLQHLGAEPSRGRFGGKALDRASSDFFPGSVQYPLRHYQVPTPRKARRFAERTVEVVRRLGGVLAQAAGGPGPESLPSEPLRSVLPGQVPAERSALGSHPGCARPHGTPPHAPVREAVAALPLVSRRALEARKGRQGLRRGSGTSPFHHLLRRRSVVGGIRRTGHRRPLARPQARLFPEQKGAQPR